MLISTTTIENIKQAAHLPTLVREQGVALKKAGANMIGKCPFHNERTGSFNLYGPGHSRYKCFGCNASGNAIDFYMHFHPTLTYPQALRELAQQFGVVVIEEKP